MKIRLLSLVVAALMLAGCQTGNISAPIGTEIAVSEWLSYGSSQVTFLYPSDINLRRLEARLRTRYFSVSSTERDLFTNPAYPVEKRILARLESVLLRTEQVLAMYPPMDLKIKIFRTREELSQEHVRLTGSLQRYKSFYVHGFETIYSSMQDISDSVIAHEMAHAVIDHYFRVPPPEKAAELLATYVDSHLEKD
ncbi:MAG: hypothetical protein PHS66_03755 [Candidatus Omnitrophica bacterium]|nr:hypothetical protein [Candidatus Omnitrophota bacterium]